MTRSVALATLAITACTPTEVTEPGDDTGPVETCDEVPWYADADADTYGDPGVVQEACEAPEGYVADSADCDDAHADAHPGATEVCGGYDNDCDGLVDEADPDLADGAWWYPDADGDGYGDWSARATYACTAPTGYALDATDCDDGDPTVHPGAKETWYDGVDQDCLHDDDFDADADEWAALPWGEDCDDADPTVHPEAPDWPNDGVDNDCDGTAPDGPAGYVTEGGEATVEATLVPGLVADVALVLDTTGSMGTYAGLVSLELVRDALPARIADLRFGLAHYEDYYFSSFGYSGDLPFELLVQVTDDDVLVQEGIDEIPTGYGGDLPESTMEALWQAVSGAGYDMDCDEAYSSSEDVLPFLAAEDDPFGGLGGGTCDPDVSGTGTLGGMGFREDATPVLLYYTDAAFRDPDDGDGTPDGCPFDAGEEDVVEGVGALGGYVAGLIRSTTASIRTEAEALAAATSSYGDTDGDGSIDDALVAVNTATSSAAISAAVGDLVAEWAPSVVPEVVLTVEGDDLGLVTATIPGSWKDVDLDAAPTLTVAFDLAGSAPAGEEGVVIPLTLRLQGGDRYQLGSTTFYVCVTPAG